MPDAGALDVSAQAPSVTATGVSPASDRPTESRAEVVSLCVGNALGTCVGFVVPLWVAAFVREAFLSTSAVGWLASAQLFLLAGAGIATSVHGGAFNQRRVAVALAGLVALGALLAAVHHYWAVVTGLFIFAIASGVLHSLMIRAGALRKDAPRVLALMTAAAMGFGSITTFFSRHAMGHIGVSGLFLLIASLGVAAGVLMFLGFPDRSFAGSGPSLKGQKGGSFLRLAPILACVAGAFVNMAGTTTSAYVLLFASDLGFSAAAATTALAVSEPFSLFGSLVAHQLGERLGVTRPILFGLAVLAADQFVLVNAPSLGVFSIALIISGVTFAFYIPYAMTLVGRLDASGRLVGALPGLITLGASVGPALGGTVIAAHSFRALPVVAGFLYVAAVTLFWSVGYLIIKESKR